MRAESARAWFGGAGPLESAFPELTDLRLTDPLVLEGRLALLQRRAEARALERVAPLPALPSRRDTDRLVKARAGALDAEETADDLEHRLLSGVRACLRTVPGLTEPALQPARAALRTARPPEQLAGPDTTEAPLPPETLAKVLALTEAEAAFDRTARALVHQCSVPGSDQLQRQLTQDLEALGAAVEAPSGDPVTAAVQAALVARVSAARSLLPEDDAARAAELLQQWEWGKLRRRIAALEDELKALQAAEAVLAVDEQTTVEVLEARLVDRQADLAAARTAQNDLQSSIQAQGAVGTTDAMRIQETLLQVQIAELRVQQAQGAVQRAKRRAELGLELTATDDQVAAAKAAAEAARARASEEGAEGEVDAEARLAEQIASFSEEYARLLATGKARHDRAAEAADALTKALEEQAAAQAAARGLGPLDPRRQSELDAVYVALRRIVSEARAEVARCDDAQAQARLHADERMDSLPDPSSLTIGEDNPRVAEWQKVLAELQEELASQPIAAAAELNAALGVLADAKAARRESRAEASSDARSLANRSFIPELQQEVREVGPMLIRAGRELLALGQRLPSLLVDLTAIGAFLRGSFEFLIILGAWLFLRGRARRFGSDFAEQAQAVRPSDDHGIARVVHLVENRGINGDWRNLATSLSQAGRRGVDILTGLIVLRLLNGQAVAIELIVLAWVVFRGVLLVGDLTQLSLTVPGENRPAARRLAPKTRDLVGVSLRLALFWLGGTEVLERLTLDLLDGDRLNDLVGALSTLFAWGLVLVGLAAWSSAIHGALADVADDALSSRLAKPARSVILRVPQAAVALVVLIVRTLARLGNNLAEGRGSLGWLRSAMARQSLRTSVDAPVGPPSSEVWDALASFEDGRLGFCEEEAEIGAAFAAWQSERRRGMVAITGQRGCGKSRLMGRLPALLDGELPVRAAQMAHEQTDPEVVLKWLMQTCAPDLPEPAEGWSTESAVEALIELPPSLFLVDDLHRCFLRAVGGFSALREVLTVMHAASGRHFWVCGFHGETWAWLEGVRGAVNLGVFRTRVRIRELDDERLRDWLEARARGIGVEPRYTHLSTGGLRTVDPARAVERARTAYWRLLADASRGNPRVAHAAWLTSLRAGDEEGTVNIVLFEQPDVALLEEAGDLALFLLAALVVHDGLPVDLLAESLNISVAQVRSTCRRLQGLGVLSGDTLDRYYKVVPEWSAVVDRRLRQKHLIHRQ